MLLRAALATTSNATMMSGLYPLVPHLFWRALAGRGGELAPPRVAPTHLVSEWAIGVAVSATRPLGFLERPVWTPQRNGGRPTVLVHGFALSRSSFLILASRLKRAGVGSIYGFEYWSLSRVDRAADALARFVDQVRDAHGGGPIDLIGHSMGGVIARHMVTRGDDPSRVRKVVSIGSPHGGTEATYLGVGPPSRDLRPGSAFLAQLAAATLPSGASALSIWSRADSLVWCARQATWPGVPEIVYDDLGHMAMLVSRRVAADVARFLTDAAPPR